MIAPRWAATVAGIAICSVLVWIILPMPSGLGVLQTRESTTGAKLPTAAGWTLDVVQFHYPRWGPDCQFVNSSAHVDRFCLQLYGGPAGYILNGTFDHGARSPSYALYLSQSPPCRSMCPTNATWISPDGTGRIWWGFSPNVTLYALD